MTTADFLEIPEIRATVSPVTVEQYHTFPERNQNGRHTELIRGVIIEKMSKSPLHATLIARLNRVLHRQLPDEFSIRQDNPVTLRDSEPEPDVAIVRGSIDDFCERHPVTAALAIEIAVTSLPLDRAKAALYAEAGVEEYWIVLARERRVEVYRAPVGELYTERTLVEGDALLECRSVPGVKIALSDLFI